MKMRQMIIWHGHSFGQMLTFSKTNWNQNKNELIAFYVTSHHHICNWKQSVIYKSTTGSQTAKLLLESRIAAGFSVYQQPCNYLLESEYRYQGQMSWKNGSAAKNIDPSLGNFQVPINKQRNLPIMVSS